MKLKDNIFDIDPIEFDISSDTIDIETNIASMLDMLQRMMIFDHTHPSHLKDGDRCTFCNQTDELEEPCEYEPESHKVSRLMGADSIVLKDIR
jgi:hypothetical protein